jgi:hypothetical protein
MTNNSKLLDFLRSILGPYKSYTGEEYYFSCPFCVKHDNKKKLAVKLDKNDIERFQHWHCWRDDTHKGSNLISLVRKLKLPQDRVSELKSILKTYGITYDINAIENGFHKNTEENKKPDACLPDGFHSFADISDGPEYKNAMSYIKKRGITGSDIIKNNIGYCDSGKYQGYIIIPSYDEAASLNYFVARSYYVDEGAMRHKNPPMSKNIVFNELHINWNFPVILCEGVFDALAIKRNVIPLLGKTLNDAVREKIFYKKVKDIYLCLDADALKSTVRYIEDFLRNDINVYFVQLPGKDPNKIGFETMSKLIKGAEKVNFSDLIKLKLSI